VALVRRGQIAFETGDYPLATALFSEARDLFRGLGGLSGPEVPTVLWLAEVAQAKGDIDLAQRLYDEVLVEARGRGDNHAVAHSLRELARLHRTRGDPERALALLYESAPLYLPLKDLRCTCILLEDLAGVLCERCQPTDAARLLAAAEAVRELVGKPLTRVQIGPHERDLATVQHRLDPESLAAAWAGGRAMSWEQGIAFAVTLHDAPTHDRDASLSSADVPVSPSPALTLPGLTARESEVARLIARGLSNRQIAEALIISERTADSHVYRVLNKLGFTSRSQIAVWAVRHGLGDESA
jgi:DNA-binding CsgD family transcriptional regulator